MSGVWDICTTSKEKDMNKATVVFTFALILITQSVGRAELLYEQAPVGGGLSGKTLYPNETCLMSDPTAMSSGSWYVLWNGIYTDTAAELVTIDEESSISDIQLYYTMGNNASGYTAISDVSVWEYTGNPASPLGTNLYYGFSEVAYWNANWNGLRSSIDLVLSPGNYIIQFYQPETGAELAGRPYYAELNTYLGNSGKPFGGVNARVAGGPNWFIPRRDIYPAGNWVNPAYHVNYRLYGDVVPEPSTLLLLATGLVGMTRRRRKKPMI